MNINYGLIRWNFPTTTTYTVGNKQVVEKIHKQKLDQVDQAVLKSNYQEARVLLEQFMVKK